MASIDFEKDCIIISKNCNYYNSEISINIDYLFKLNKIGLIVDELIELLNDDNDDFRKGSFLTKFICFLNESSYYYKDNLHFYKNNVKYLTDTINGDLKTSIISIVNNIYHKTIERENKELMNKLYRLLMKLFITKKL